MNIHNLDGCAPTPLAHYLKALGILRLVAEQADSEARGWWEGERFRLATRLGRAELGEFLLQKYRPTAMFNPWGARSGFYPEASEKSARGVLEEIEASTDERFVPYQTTIRVVKELISSTTGGNKPTDDDKDKLIMALRRGVRGTSTQWLDSVCAVLGSGDHASIGYPALFGTGGSEGSGSYTSAYMQAIDECLLKHRWDHAISAALHSEGPIPECQWNQSMGQFVPAGMASPWDLLLAFEGACTVRTAVSSRNASDAGRWMSSPFFVAPTALGYASNARLDERVLNKGKELPGRGEQWFPLWSQPMSLAELEQMFSEGRATTKRTRASDGWSMVRAITSQGVRRGIREFVRYGYQQRNNLAAHFAVPLGRFVVPEAIPPMLASLDDLDAWLRQLRKLATAKETPSRFCTVERRLGDALFAVSQHADEPGRWQAVLHAIADTEGVMATGTGIRAGPAPRLRPDWVRAADDGSPELRLAVTFSLQARAFSLTGHAPIDAVRMHWLPLKGSRFATTGSGAQTRLQVGPDVVMQGRSGLADAIALVERRLVQAARRGERRLPLVAARGAAAHPADLAALVAGEVDLDRTVSLARAFMAIDGRAWASRPRPPRRPASGRQPDDAWLLLRLAMLPWPLPDGRRIGCDPAIFRRLEAGDLGSASELALRRLRATGIRTAVRAATASPSTGRLWAAALAFPIDTTTAAGFVRRLDLNQEILS